MLSTAQHAGVPVPGAHAINGVPQMPAHQHMMRLPTGAIPQPDGASALKKLRVDAAGRAIPAPGVAVGEGGVLIDEGGRVVGTCKVPAENLPRQARPLPDKPMIVKPSGGSVKISGAVQYRGVRQRPWGKCGPLSPCRAPLRLCSCRHGHVSVSVPQRATRVRAPAFQHPDARPHSVGAARAGVHRRPSQYCAASPDHSAWLVVLAIQSCQSTTRIWLARYSQ